jgi:hypothetical protein
MNRLKKILALSVLLSISISFATNAEGSKLPSGKSKMRREILKHLGVPKWMTKEMQMEKVNVVFTMSEDGRPQLKRINGESKKLCNHVIEQFSMMQLDTTVMLSDTEYLMTLEFDVR